MTNEEMCWYCGERSAAYKSRNVVFLNNGREEKTITIPRCAICNELTKTFHKNLNIGVGVGMLFVLFYITLVVLIAPNISLPKGIVNTPLEGILQIFLVILPIVLFIAFIVVMFKRTINSCKRNGIELRTILKTHPTVAEHLQIGWVLGKKPFMMVKKACEKCGKIVPVESQAGDRCPFCGAFWASERWK